MIGDSPKFVQQMLPVMVFLGASPAVQVVVVDYRGAVWSQGQARTKWVSADAGGRLSRCEEAPAELDWVKRVSTEEAVLVMSPN